MYAHCLALIVAGAVGAATPKQPETTVRGARNGVTMGFDPAIGLARVAVRRGGAQSIAMPLLVEAANPSLFMHVGATSLIVQTVADAPAADPAGVASQLELGRRSVAIALARQLLETGRIRLGNLSVSDRPRPFALDR